MIYSFSQLDEGGNFMMQNPHFSSLETKHSVLDRRISDESHRPMPDQLLIAELKRQKLRVKEEMSRL